MSTSNNSTLLKGKPIIQHILLADDDEDDCLLFKDALAELPSPTQFTCVTNGEKLMHLLSSGGLLPDILFLDLNMPRKNGLQCLLEIKAIESLATLPVIILSTSFEPNMMDRLYQTGAMLCVRKPNEFFKLKEVISSALSLTAQAFTVGTAAVVYQPI